MPKNTRENRIKEKSITPEWKAQISVITSDRGLAKPFKEGRRGRTPMCEVKTCDLGQGVERSCVLDDEIYST